jgi:hypothetical protein
LPQKACNLAPPIVEGSCWKDRFCDCIWCWQCLSELYCRSFVPL